MVRTLGKLNALQVSRLSKPGYYGDGGGLYLQVLNSTSKSWLFRFTLAGRAREMGLGSLAAVSLQQARAIAADARTLRTAGVDPIAAREAARSAAALEAARAILFKDAAAQFIVSKGPGWKNAKHLAQWESTLKTYVEPVIGHLPVQEIDTDHVLIILRPIWTAKQETASRVRGRIEQILDWCAARRYRTGDNPARWRGHLKHLLAEQGRAVKHHAAMPFADVPTFMETLQGRIGIGSRALEFTILTAGRTSEITGMTWPEIDMAARVWTIPGARMKAGREHRVPLSDRAIEILQSLDSTAVYVFPGASLRRPISNMTMAKALDALDARWTVHGFRSSFRDWVEERTGFSGEVAEMALAHVVKNKVEAAYRRGDLLDKRRALMAAWADYCEAKSAANVLPMVRSAEGAA